MFGASIVSVGPWIFGKMKRIIILKSILGISAYYHDSAACLVQDGQIVAAAQEERFTRKETRCGVSVARG